jgi:hypothetical protein
MMLTHGMLQARFARSLQSQEPPMPPSSAADFHARVRQAGLSLTEAETAVAAPAWQKLEAWLESLRSPPIPAEAEPATTFKASTGSARIPTTGSANIPTTGSAR